MPFGFSLMGLAFAWALFRHRLLDLVPIARHTMVESMADGMIVLDGRDRIVDLNPAAEALLGRREETIGRSMSELLPSWEERVADLARDQELYSAISLTGDGTLRHYDLHVTPLRGQRLNQTGRLVVLHDVTERQGVEAALQQEIEAREELISDLDAFAHTTAHDLKAPLSFLTGYTFLLRERLEDEGNEEILAFVQSIDRTAFKMARIVDELLLLASVRQHEVTVAPLDMGAIVREVEERLEPAIAEAGAEVRKPETWPTALGHAPWVEEVWANYLSNAIKYGGVPPEVELGAEQDEENFVRFWVRDNGLGLTGEEQARLFAPYTRLQQVRAKGQGLGLSITRRIVEKLGGDVDVESEPGEGSTFSFRLPGGTSGEVVPRDDD
jgi:PAS domain S-box-containing protein